jgi:hypothetical protein
MSDTTTQGCWEVSSKDRIASKAAENVSWLIKVLERSPLLTPDLDHKLLLAASIYLPKQDVVRSVRQSPLILLNPGPSN